MYADVKEDGCEAAFKFLNCGVKINPKTVSYNKNIPKLTFM